MQKKIHIKKGDTVMVIAGESKGQQGRVLKIFRSTNKAIVEGVNMVSKHSRPSAKNPKGGVVKQEAPIHISNLMYVEVATGNVTRIGRRVNEENKIVRYAKKSGEEIK